ncbi:MAG TPA: hypothetical protein VNF73_11995, partial [Candidatus Saccharimonadales bacterium]|nr:hypothetical protein [Candidatus Saccharimonadales bacterium]
MRLVAAAVLVVATVAWSAAVVLAASAPSSVTIGSASTGLGQVLAGPNGHTLYTLSSDPNNASTCTGACTGPWPPLLVASGGTVTAAAGVSGSLTTFVRSDSSTQVADNGRALYYFVHDTAAGQTNGEGIVAFGGTWHVVKLAAATG